MNWKDDVSDKAKDTMKFLGDFGPTVHANRREVKGYVHDDEGGGKAYLESSDLREMAGHLIEVADWLDRRAEESQSSIVTG